MKPTILNSSIAHFFMLLFVYTAVAKIFNLTTNGVELGSLPSMGSLATITTVAVPILELTIVVMLFFPAWRQKGLWASLILLALFTLYILRSWLIGDQLSCGCGGILEDLSQRQHLLLNSACMALACIGIYGSRTNLMGAAIKFKWPGTTLTILLFGLITWVILRAEAAPSAVKTGLEGRSLPSFDILLTDSVTHLDTKDIPGGKPFIMIAFSPYCPHCRREIADIEHNMEKFAGTHFFLITPYSISELKTFYQSLNLSSYPNITVGVDYNDAFLSYFKSRSVPYTAIYDAKRRLAQGIPGRADIVTLYDCVKY
jgi:thiol-disulfide isomerase/thioredoxin